MKQYEGMTLQGTNISHLGKRNIIFKSAFFGGYVSSPGGYSICQKHWSFCEKHRSLADSMAIPGSFPPLNSKPRFLPQLLVLWVDFYDPNIYEKQLQ